MERHERQEDARARDLMPAGFYIVRDGSTRPDDLVYSWSSKEWIPANDPGWLQPTPANVSDCVAVARSAVFREPGFEDVRRRSYSLTPGTADNAGSGVTIADFLERTAKPPPDPNQISLF